MTLQSSSIMFLDNRIEEGRKSWRKKKKWRAVSFLMLTATGFLLQRGTKEAVALQLWGRHALWAALASCQHTICITDKVQKGVGKICLSLKITSEWEGAASHPNYNFSHSVFKPVGFITHGFRYQAIGYPSPPQLAPSPKRGKSRFRRFISPHNRLGEGSTLWHSLLSTGITALQAPLGRKQEGVDWDSDTQPQPRVRSNRG